MGNNYICSDKLKTADQLLRELFEGNGIENQIINNMYFKNWHKKNFPESKDERFYNPLNIENIKESAGINNKKNKFNY